MAARLRCVRIRDCGLRIRDCGVCAHRRLRHLPLRTIVVSHALIVYRK